MAPRTLWFPFGSVEASQRGAILRFIGAHSGRLEWGLSSSRQKDRTAQPRVGGSHSCSSVTRVAPLVARRRVQARSPPPPAPTPVAVADSHPAPAPPTPPALSRLTLSSGGGSYRPDESSTISSRAAISATLLGRCAKVTNFCSSVRSETEPHPNDLRWTQYIKV